MSYGNYWTSVRLDSGEMVIITGVNGSGKSTVTYAIYFALTGLPMSDINKAGLVNTYSGKGAMVELKFEIGNNQYLVRRGIFPNLFEIHENGELISEDGKKVDFYQKRLDKIVGLTPTLIRSVMLINSSYKSFFSLSKQERRTFSDRLFGLSRFNRMIEIEKKKQQELSASVSEKETEVLLARQSLEHQRNLLEQYDTIAEKIKQQKTEDKMQIESEIESLRSKIESERESLISARNASADAKKLETSAREKVKKNSSVRAEMSKIREKITNLDSTKDGRCHACNQILPQDKIDDFKKEIANLEAKLLEKESVIDLTADSELDAASDAYRKAEKESSRIETELSSSKKLLSSHEKRLSGFSTELPERPSVDIEGTQSKINDLVSESEKLAEMLRYLKITNKILLEGELKAYIIGNYVPFMNEQMNAYLEMFGMDLKIKFDSDLEYKFHSRKHSKYEFGNFSTGERTRLNLCIMLTFIQVHKLVNFKSLAQVTNVMFVDEFFDMGTDVDGIEACLSVLREINKKSKCGVFLVTHKIQAESTDFTVYSAAKEGEFSRLKRTQ